MSHEPASPLSALDVIFMRRSVRAYTSEPIDEPTIRGLLDAAVQAPTAMHAEPWGFVVIKDRALLKRYSDRAKGYWANQVTQYRDLHRRHDDPTQAAFAERFAAPDFCVFYGATTLIAVCATSTAPFVEADCWLAAENLMLAACALGLGTCCIGSAVPVLNSPETKSELGISPDVTIVVPIIVGAPKGPVADVPRKIPQILSWKRGH